MIALAWLFSNMCFKMFPQITSMQKTYTHIGCICVVWCLFQRDPNNLLVFAPLLCNLHFTLSGGCLRLKPIFLVVVASIKYKFNKLCEKYTYTTKIYSHYLKISKQVEKLCCNWGGQSWGPMYSELPTSGLPTMYAILRWASVRFTLHSANSLISPRN